MEGVNIELLDLNGNVIATTQTDNTGAGDFEDPDPGAWSATVAYGDGSGTQSLTLTDKTFVLNHVYTDDGSYTVTLTVTDDDNGIGADIVSITVNNVSPTVGPITAPLDPTQVNKEITASAAFTDPGILDTHTALWDWGDSATPTGTVIETNGAGTAIGTHPYITAGVYTITLTVTDKDGDSGTAQFQYVVVYDSTGGFVTGGGWIWSKKGACPIFCDGAVGKANFGFVSKYKKGATVPTGQTEFQFKAGDLNFHSDSYQWLVVAGHRAQFKGDGTINGVGGFGFFIVGIDGDVNGHGGSDEFRIKLWYTDTDQIVYDNGLAADDDADVATALGGGSIVIHRR